MIQAVRGVQRKYLCRLTVISAHRQSISGPLVALYDSVESESRGEGREARCYEGGVRFHFTSAGSMWIAGVEVSIASHCADGGGERRTGRVVGAKSRHSEGLVAVVGRVEVGMRSRGCRVGV